MHDLNVITRLNAEAFAASIQNYRRQGRFVLAKYEGLHLVSIETFSDQAGAQQALDSAVAAQHGGERNVLFAPMPVAGVPMRDQSEDRKQPFGLEQLAELGRRSAAASLDAEQTLGDYISRKSALLDNPQE